MNTKNNTVFFGARAPFSKAVFNTLIQNNIPISRVFCIGHAPAIQTGRALPVETLIQDASLDNLAKSHNIPVTYLSQADDLNRLTLSSQPDYVLIACFPYRIPDVVIHWPRFSCLNLHPSLLPRYRGPDPIFWQLHEGESETGISLHMVTADFDSGPIVKQRLVSYDDGMYKSEIETLLGKEGANLFISLVKKQIAPESIAQPQDEIKKSYYPAACKEDYQLSTNWSARRAYNFIRGTWPPIDQYKLSMANNTYYITQALEYFDSDQAPEPDRINDEELLITFSPGILRARTRQ